MYVLKKVSSHTVLLLYLKESSVPCCQYTQKLYEKRGNSDVTVF